MDTCASNGFRTPRDVLSSLLNPTNCTGIVGVISVFAYPNLIINSSIRFLIPFDDLVIIYLVQMPHDRLIYINHFIPKLHTALPHKIHAIE